MSDPITPLTPAETAAQEAKALKENFAVRDAVAFDELVNVLTDGPPDETVSSRMGRWAKEDSGLKRDIGVAVSKALGLIQPDHDVKAQAGDVARAEQVIAVEQASGNIDAG